MHRRAAEKAEIAGGRLKVVDSRITTDDTQQTGPLFCEPRVLSIARLGGIN
jgi:hypothetical protein